MPRAVCGQLGCILPGEHAGAHDIGQVLRRRRVPVIKPAAVIKPAVEPPRRPFSPPLPRSVTLLRVGDTVELELVEDEAPDEAFWAPARVSSVSSLGAFAAKIYAPGSAWHAWVEKDYLLAICFRNDKRPVFIYANPSPPTAHRNPFLQPRPFRVLQQRGYRLTASHFWTA